MTVDVLSSLQTRRDAIATELAAMNSTTAGGLPDAPQGGGIKHVEYRLSLYKELEELNRQISIYEGPWEVVTQGRP